MVELSCSEICDWKEKVEVAEEFQLKAQFTKEMVTVIAMLAELR